MKYVEAPEEWKPESGEHGVFLGGGITDCPDWQAEVRQMLAPSPLTVISPRRAEWPIDDQTASASQIMWEHRHLKRADIVSFWFPCETLCPITLYELGAWSMTNKPLVVGVHYDYKRILDVEIQTALARPDVQIEYTLAGFAAQIMDWRPDV